MPFALKQAAVFRIKWPICSFLLLTTLKVSQEKPHQDWTIVCKRCTVETVLRRFSHLAESLGRQLRDKLLRNSNSSFIQHSTTSNRKEMYLGLTDIHSDQLSAAVFIFHSGYKLISCCFHLLRDPLLVLSVYWQVYVMKRDGRVKRPANRSEFVHSFEFFKLCDEKLSLNSLHPTAQKTYL